MFGDEPGTSPLPNNVSFDDNTSILTNSNWRLISNFHWPICVSENTDINCKPVFTPI